jgi:hypothetical protein
MLDRFCFAWLNRYLFFVYIIELLFSFFLSRNMDPFGFFMVSFHQAIDLSSSSEKNIFARVHAGTTGPLPSTFNQPTFFWQSLMALAIQ